MNFNEQLLLTLIDKGLLALVFVLIGFGFNSLLERQKAKAGLLLALAPLRAEAFRALWSKTEKVGFSRRDALSAQSRETLFKELTKWYYDEGGAMFLSFKASQQFMRARNQLRDSSVDDKTIRASFSSLRTQLKLDCGIYTKRESRKPIIEPANRSFEPTAE